MRVDQVVQGIKNKDWDLVDQSGQIGAEAAPAILPFLDDPDREVRELSVQCLNQAGGPLAKQGLFKALHDSYAMVRSAASACLHAHADGGDLPALMRELAGNEDEYVREQVALVVGRIAAQDVLAQLRQQIGQERDDHARNALSLAMLRLGDRPRVDAYIGRLQSTDVEVRVAALKDFEYLRQNEYVRYIRPMLDDKRDGMNVAPGGHYYFIRVCDVAINVLDKALDHPFPFPADPVKRYSDEELAQAKTAIAKL